MTELQLLQLLKQVKDPEIPVLSIVDMGIVRKTEIEDGKLRVFITPTYMGCPAMDTIAADLKAVLKANGATEVEVKTVIAGEGWTTDWMTEEGKQKLKEYGIAPPLSASADKRALMGETHQVPCPHCKSTHTQMVSIFGSTACKALFKCLDCLEPFDYFKCLK